VDRVNAMRFDILVEEESAERMIRVPTPRIIPGVTFDVRSFPGKAWLFGDVEALRQVYARVPAPLDRQACPPKIRVAGAVARHMDVERNRSRSFAQSRSGIRRLVDAERVA